MIKNSVAAILLCFIVISVKCQEPECYKYNFPDASYWINNTSCLIINDSIGSEIVEIKVTDVDSGTIKLIPTENFPGKYSCELNDTTKISDEFKFERKIKKFRPNPNENDSGGNKKQLAVEFVFSRKFIILDLTGIVALRHLIPKRETLIFRKI